MPECAQIFLVQLIKSHTTLLDNFKIILFTLKNSIVMKCRKGSMSIGWQGFNCHLGPYQLASQVGGGRGRCPPPAKGDAKKTDWTRPHKNLVFRHG